MSSFGLSSTCSVHSSKHSVSELHVSSPWIITFGGCRQQHRTENKGKQLEVQLGQRSTDPPSHRPICTHERNYSHLGAVLKPAHSMPSFTAVPALPDSTPRDERKLTANFWWLLYEVQKWLTDLQQHYCSDRAISIKTWYHREKPSTQIQVEKLPKKWFKM